MLLVAIPMVMAVVVSALLLVGSKIKPQEVRVR